MSSSKIVIKNSLIGTFAHMCSMILGFVAQRYFLRFLGGFEIQGVNSVIGETLGLLSFAELGIGSAITYRLYKPLVNKDTKSLTALMQIYQFLYRIIGVVVLVVGVILLFFLPIFINDSTLSKQFIASAYIIQLVSTASTYFFAYKRTLIYADQKQFICKIVDISFNIGFTVLRIISLFLFSSYHLYLILQLFQTVGSNMVLALYCNKHYPYVTSKNKEKFEDVRGLFHDTKNLLIGKLAGYAYSSTDNLIISTFAGVVLAGGFSTYRYVTNSIKNLINSMTDSITATIGNYIYENDVDKSYIMFKRYSFIRYAVANIAATGMCTCVDSFVGFAFGKEYIMQGIIVYLLVIDVFIGIVYGVIAEFTSVLGYFDAEKNINLMGAIINLITSVVLVQKYNVSGVLIGTCISQMFFWVAKSILLFKRYFQSKRDLCEMWRRYVGYILVVVLQIVCTYWIKQIVFLNQYDFVTFLFEGILSTVLSILVITIVYGRTDEYKYLVNILRGIINRVLRKN